MKSEWINIDGQKFRLLAEHYESASDTLAFGNVWPVKTTKLTMLNPDMAQMMAMNLQKAIDSNGVNQTQCRTIMNQMDGIEKRWFGGDHADMLRRCNGWPEGRERMLEEITQIVPEYGQAQRPRPHWDEEGYELDYDRWNEGNDRPWLKRRLRSGVRNISLTVQFGENCNIEADQLFRRGAAVVAAIDTLEDMGYRVNLTAMSTVSNPFRDPRDHTLITRVEVKRACDPVDLDYLAATVASPLFFRGNLFCLRMSTKYPTESGLGCTQSCPIAMREDLYIETLPTSPKEARSLYESIISKANDKMLNKTIDTAV